MNEEPTGVGPPGTPEVVSREEPTQGSYPDVTYVPLGKYKIISPFFSASGTGRARDLALLTVVVGSVIIVVAAGLGLVGQFRATENTVGLGLVVVAGAAALVAAVRALIR